MKQIMSILPPVIKEYVNAYELHEHIEEIRLRIDHPLELIVRGKPFYPKKNDKPYIVQNEDKVYVLNKLSQFSLYTLEEELRKGYITINGGHRVGLAGKVITENGNVKAIRDISSFNIRVARQKKDIALPFVRYLYEKQWLNTLLIGAPQTGKTTLLRDIARLVSVGDRVQQIYPLKVGIVDERSEIAGCVKGIPQHDLGPRIDVLDACPKAEGMMMLIRSMSPDVIIVDEIGRREDCEAIIEAVHAGVKVIVTAHGNRIEDVLNRPSIKPLIDMGIFDRYIELGRDVQPGKIKRIRDKQFRDLTIKSVRVLEKR
jgi:stage III sporulation protein AA